MNQQISGSYSHSRAIGSFLMVGGWVKPCWLSRTPYNIPNLDQKFGPENKWLKTSYLDFNFLIQVFWLKVSKSTKLAKKITHFTIQFRSKNLTHFTNLNSLNITKKYTPATQSNTCFWLRSKKTCTAPLLDA